MNPHDEAAASVGRTRQEIEAWLSEHLAARLNVPEIDPEKPVASYGLHSIAAMRMLDKLEGWLGRRLPPTVLFEYPSVRALADAIACGSVTEADDYVDPDADCY